MSSNFVNVLQKHQTYPGSLKQINTPPDYPRCYIWYNPEKIGHSASSPL